MHSNRQVKPSKALRTQLRPSTQFTHDFSLRIPHKAKRAATEGKLLANQMSSRYSEAPKRAIRTPAPPLLSTIIHPVAS